ncbi:MAG: hypothetical protein ACRBF0_03990 [Calditrichia bacterium]
MCFLEYDGIVKVIINPSGQSDEDNAVIIRTLNTAETEQYCLLVEEGYSEDTIFEEMFPEYTDALNEEVETESKPATKSDLAKSIRDRIGKQLPSLEKMTKADLNILEQKLKT